MTMGLNRKTYSETLVELGRTNNDIIVLEGDIGKSTFTKLFGNAFPERYFNIGIQEQNEVCIAAGLAAMGKTVFVSTFAVFLSMRACEQIRTAIAYPNLSVKIVATNAGVEIAGDGATHQAVEDLAIMRVIPNMKVFSPSDPVITRKIIQIVAREEGPVYMRLGRQETQVLYNDSVCVEIGKMIPLRDGKDAVIIATGHMVSEALFAADLLMQVGIDMAIWDCHTIKPIDKEAIRSAAVYGNIFTIEDHHIIGGLGSAVCEVVAEEGLFARVHRIGLDDIFPMSGRDHESLLRYFGLSREAIMTRVQSVLERKA